MQRNLVVRPAIGTALLLLVPLTLTILDRNKPVGDGWHWTLPGFLFMGSLLFGAGVIYEFVSRRLPSNTYRAALGLVILCLVAAFWVELAVDGIRRFFSGLTT